MAEKEETSTCSSTLACFEYHVSIELRAETGEQDISCYTITLLDALEVKWCVHVHLDDCVDRDLILFHYTFLL